MRHLLNTLFITSEDIYLSLDGENVVANREKREVARYPLHTLAGIVSFSYAGASPALMGACAERQVSLALCTPQENFSPGFPERATGMCCCEESNTAQRMIPKLAVESAEI